MTTLFLSTAMLAWLSLDVYTTVLTAAQDINLIKKW